MKLTAGLILLCCLAGCASPARSRSSAGPAPSPPPPPASAAAASQTLVLQGYRLLAELVGDEKDVSKLLLIKHERPELGTLIKEISATCAQAHKELLAFAKTDPSLDFKTDVLPAAERETRQQISKERRKELLHAKGKPLEVGLLLTQVEALTYAHQLAAVLAQSDSVAERKKFLVRLATDLQQLQGKVKDMLLAHYS
jgi:hypothetical protein